MKKGLLLIGFCFSCLFANAQEFNCAVQVNASQVQISDKKIFETLQSSIYEFMNNRRWSNLNYAPHERIECNLTLIIQEKNGTNFKGSLSIQVIRPVFNTTYNSVLLNFIDKDMEFAYSEYDPLDHSDGTITSNLTAVLAFYAYFTLGLTFDAYGMAAGEVFFDKAMDIVNQCQNFGKAWEIGNQNPNSRYWLVENFTNGNFSTVHDIYYTYHRKGLDVMYDNVETGRAAILNSIEKMQQLNKQKINILVKQLFIDSKSEEIINIFKAATQAEKNKLLTLMLDIDPSGMNKYQEINK